LRRGLTIPRCHEHGCDSAQQNNRTNRIGIEGHVMTLYEAVMLWLIANELFVIWRQEVAIARGFHG